MNALRPKIAVLVLARPQFDTEFAGEAVAAAWRQLATLDAEIVGSADMLFDADAARAVVPKLKTADPDLLLIIQATFTDASMTAALAEEFSAPMFMWSFPEPRTGGRLRLNTVCGLNLAGHALARHGRRLGFAHRKADDPAALAEIGAAARASAVKRRLAETRIGVIGAHPVGFDSCRYDAAALKHRFGITVEAIDHSAFLERARGVTVEEVGRVKTRVSSELEGLEAVDQEALAKSLKVYAALRRTADESGYAGLAVRCWPEFFTELGGAACGPMGMMGEDGTPCGCEADVFGTLTTLILRWLGDAPAFNTDLVDVDEADDTAVCWHCGQAPISMAGAGPRRATLHSNRKLPLLYDFALKPGRVTLARLNQAAGGLRMVVGGGEVLDRPNSYSGTSGVVRFDRPVGKVLETIIGEGLEHHMTLAYGDHRSALRHLASLLDLPVLELT